MKTALARENILRLLFAVPLKRGNMESVERSRACSLTFCSGKGPGSGKGRRMKDEGRRLNRNDAVES
jgi:hypothetical protein